VDETIIAEAVAQWRQGHPITDLQARVIASSWHGGQTSALYSFASCGNTRNDPYSDECTELVWEITTAARNVGATTQEDQRPAELHALDAYVSRVGPRGPVDGWSRLSW
jgi:hypothetical protein